MSETKPPADPAKSKRSALIGMLTLALVFIVALTLTGWWVVHFFVTQPANTVVLPPDATPAAIVPRQAKASKGPAGPAIGGVVNNEQGQPIPNVRVTLSWMQLTGPNDPNPNMQVYTSANTTTDAQGHWLSTSVPAASLGRVNLSFSQRDYVTQGTRQPAAKLLDKSVAIVMNHGIVITGVVVDAAGNPISGAQISTGRQTAAAKSGPDGKFTLRNVSTTGRLAVTATMAGLAPAGQAVNPSGKLDSLRLVMTSGRTITGSVKDNAGKPVPNTNVSLYSWLDNYKLVDVHSTTDSNGQFTLTHAPADALQFQADKRGYTGDILSLEQDKSVLDFVMSPQIAMHGTVTDALTHQPISTFMVLCGARWAEDQPPNFQSGTGRRFTAGHYQETLSGFGGHVQAWYVRVQAKGYLPADSGPLHESGTFDCELTHGQDLTGRVLDPDGKPLAGISVIAVLPNQQAEIDDSGELQGSGNPAGVTDPQGRFDLPPQNGNYILVAAGSAGFAQEDQAAVAKSTDIHLTRWGRVAGKLILGGKPGANQMVTIQLKSDAIYVPNAPRIYHQLNRQCNADGSFSFDFVPPGDVQVSRVIVTPMPSGGEAWNYTQTQDATITSGTTTTVTLGGAGRLVTGRALIPADISKRHDWFFNASATTVPNFDPPQMPASVKQASPAAQDLWRAVFLLTDAGRAYQQAQLKAQTPFRNYSLEISADGTYRIDDVLPGAYQINIYLQPAAGGQMLSQGHTQFTMPPIPGGVSDQPLQLPDIQLTK